jgi:hypothetical protein
VFHRSPSSSKNFFLQIFSLSLLFVGSRCQNEKKLTSICLPNHLIITLVLLLWKIISIYFPVEKQISSVQKRKLGKISVFGPGKNTLNPICMKTIERRIPLTVAFMDSDGDTFANLAKHFLSWVAVMKRCSSPVFSSLPKKRSPDACCFGRSFPAVFFYSKEMKCE